MTEVYKEARQKFGQYYANNKVKINELLGYLRNEYNNIVIWGAGLKGKAFLACCDEKNEYVDYVIDMDEKKQGTTLLTGHKVRGIDGVTMDGVILIVNIKYFQSICFTLANEGYDIKKMRVFCIDQYIDNEISLDDIQNNTIWRWKKYYD